MTIRISLVTVLTALAFVAIGAAGAVGVMLWEPWDGDGNGGSTVVEESPTSAPEPAPTPTGPLLTGAEAAGKAEARIRDLGSEQLQGSGVFIYCDAEDYNARTHAWVVSCGLERPDGRTVPFRVTVDDRSGIVDFID